MNPSTKGWIKKFGSLVDSESLVYKDYNDLYFKLRSTGLVYGLSDTVPDHFKHDTQFSLDELVKINFIDALFHCYCFKNENPKFEDFIPSILKFYKTLELSELSVWDKLLIGKDNFSVLERLINDRVLADNNILTRNFNKTIVNSLIFIDVIAYERYLRSDYNIKDYVSNLESMVMNITYDALSFKDKKKKADTEILSTIQESTSFIETDRADLNQFYHREIETKYSSTEKKYFIDMACLSVWEDQFVDDKEYNFIKALGADMNLSEENVNDSLSHIATFYKKHKNNFLIFKSSSQFSVFYENSSQYVAKLIKRNSKRIFRELNQSKDLMLLLTQATTRELTKEEQNKVQAQLKDIFKTIPSLAIFILPGGAILLPIVAKLIPNMLPSAFDDNKIEE